MSVSPRHALSVWQRNLAMYSRSWKLNILPNFFEPVFYLMSIGIGVGAYVSDMGGVSYIEFLAPGLVCVAAMNGASFEVTYNIFVRMNFEKAYDAMLTAPLTPDDIIAGEVLWALTRSSLYGLCFLVVTTCFGLATPLGVLAGLLMVPISGLLFSAIGLAFTMRIQNIDLFSFYFTLFLTPLFLFSGVFFPLEERLTGPWLWVAELLPLLHPVRIVRGAFQGDMGWLQLWDLGYCLALTLLLLGYSRGVVRARLTL